MEREQMDLSVLPNNNHPKKFLQLDSKLLLTTHGFCQAEKLESATRHLQDRVSSKVLCDKHSWCIFISRCVLYLEFLLMTCFHLNFQFSVRYSQILDFFYRYSNVFFSFFIQLLKFMNWFQIEANNNVCI